MLFDFSHTQEPSFQASTTKRAKPGATKPIPTEFDLSSIVPEDAKQFDTLKKIIDFAYTGRLPLATDVGFKHFFVTAVALQFQEALRVYDMYFIHFFKKKQRLLPLSAAAIILTECQKIRQPFMLSSCAEYLDSISDNTSKYVLIETFEKLYTDQGFLAYLSVDALLVFLERDDLTKRADELQVCF